MDISEARDTAAEQKSLIDGGYALARGLYEAACNERDKSGHREDLGYDQFMKLKESISPLKNENFKAYYGILKHYNTLCDLI